MILSCIVHKRSDTGKNRLESFKTKNTIETINGEDIEMKGHTHTIHRSTDFDNDDEKIPARTPEKHKFWPHRI